MIDLMSNVTFTEAQLAKRREARLLKDFPKWKQDVMNRRTFGQIRGKYTLSKEELAEESNFETLVAQVKNDYDKAVLDNQLLKEVIQYEQSKQRLERYILSGGVKAVPEVPEIRDEKTGEITQEHVPGVKGIEPLDKTIVVNILGDDGEITGTKEVPNPVVEQDIDERKTAQQIIDTSDNDVLTLVVERNLED